MFRCGRVIEDMVWSVLNIIRNKPLKKIVLHNYGGTFHFLHFATLTSELILNQYIYFTISGDKIKSIKIEFTGTPLEDAVGILSLASPYPVELELIEGGRASGAGRGVQHPLLKRAGSTSDVNTVRKCL